MAGNFCSAAASRTCQSFVTMSQVLSAISKLKGTWADGTKSTILWARPSNLTIQNAPLHSTQISNQMANSKSITQDGRTGTRIAPAFAAKQSAMSKMKMVSVSSTSSSGSTTRSPTTWLSTLITKRTRLSTLVRMMAWPCCGSWPENPRFRPNSNKR